MQLKAAHLSQTKQRKTSHATAQLIATHTTYTTYPLQIVIYNATYSTTYFTFSHVSAYLVGINQIDYSHNKVIDTF